ncbi:ROK family transcriptional regulator [Jatrophihabitans sp.]|uniref:ROK family transcriptional regulator n=1 Tax=Jatrophihabitans sp. TaxID=1932789 RepID=UPI002CE62190|nr:ROK family transcriptional regulator [Jatrophihabitans sp.]
MTSERPSLALLRSMSDEAVLRVLLDTPRLTRAQLAVATGLSKPTAAEAIRRLEAAGLVRDTGERTTGRGGVGSYYALADAAGVALAVAIAPDGVVVEVVDPAGTVTDRVREDVRQPATPASVTALLRKAARRALGARPAGSVRVAVVSAADPVDRVSGDLVQLPDAPFLLGAMSPRAVLRPLFDGPVLVDNDVNWAALAERDARLAQGQQLRDFVYLYLGEGIGLAVVADGAVRRGHRGIAGEVAHVTVTGPGGTVLPLTELFAQLGLRRPGSIAIDVDRLLAALHRPDDDRTAAALIRAVRDLVTAAIAFCDPECVVLGGPWGTDQAVLDSLRRDLDGHPRGVPVERAVSTGEPSLSGARTAALAALRTDIVARIPA